MIYQRIPGSGEAKESYYEKTQIPTMNCAKCTVCIFFIFFGRFFLTERLLRPFWNASTREAYRKVYPYHRVLLVDTVDG